MDLAYSMDRLRVGASMSALEVEDELEGGRRGEKVLLARSSLTSGKHFPSEVRVWEDTGRAVPLSSHIQTSVLHLICAS